MGASVANGEAPGIGQAAAGYLEFLADGGRSAHTVASTRTDLAQLAQFLGRQRVDTVATEDLRAFFRWLDRQRGNKVSSLRRKTSSVKGLFTYLYATGQTKFDAAAAILYPALEISRPRPLSRAEADALFGAAHLPSWRVLVGLLLDCGLKRDELVAMRWEDLERSSREGTDRLHVRRRQASRRVRRRVLGVSSRLEEAIESHRGVQEKLDGPLLAISPRGVDFVVEMLGRRAGVRQGQKVTPQMLRDAYALRRVAELRKTELEFEPSSEERNRLEGQHDLVLLRELGLSDRGDAARRYRRLLEQNEADWAE